MWNKEADNIRKLNKKTDESKIDESPSEGNAVDKSSRHHISVCARCSSHNHNAKNTITQQIESPDPSYDPEVKVMVFGSRGRYSALTPGPLWTTSTMFPLQLSRKPCHSSSLLTINPDFSFPTKTLFILFFPLSWDTTARLVKAFTVFCCFTSENCFCGPWIYF